MYEYWATVVNVHDGDTVTVDVDLGFSTWRRNQRLRLAGISALELSMPGGKEARNHLREVLPTGTRVTLRSYRAEADPADLMSFDRYVVRLRSLTGVDVAEQLIHDGYAVPWDGRTKPVPYPLFPVPTTGSVT